MLLHRPVGSVASGHNPSSHTSLREGVNLPRNSHSPSGTRCRDQVAAPGRLGPVVPASRARASGSPGATSPANAFSPSGRNQAKSPIRRPNRSRTSSPDRSPVGIAGPRANANGPRHARASLDQHDVFEQQKALLESEVDRANHNQLTLEQMLIEERQRGAADRAKLAALGTRIEQLEQSQSMAAQWPSQVYSEGIVQKENYSLHSEFEAQSRQLELLRKQVDILKFGRQPAESASDARPVESSETMGALEEENLRLRRDLEQSRDMLSRYTEEMACVMPGMQKVLQKFNQEHEVGRSPFSFEQDRRQRDPGDMISHEFAAIQQPQQPLTLGGGARTPQPPAEPRSHIKAGVDYGAERPSRIVEEQRRSCREGASTASGAGPRLSSVNSAGSLRRPQAPRPSSQPGSSSSGLRTNRKSPRRFPSPSQKPRWT